MNKTAIAFHPEDPLEQVWVKSIWLLKDENPILRREHILPKGTVEIIFNFSDPIVYQRLKETNNIYLPEVFINGVNFNPFELIKTGTQYFLGIQLHSAAIKLLFNISASIFNNKVVDGRDFCVELTQIKERLFSEKDFSLQCKIIMDWLRKRVSNSDNENTLRRLKSLSLCLDKGNMNVKKMAEILCISDRQLRRFSTIWLGMSTEDYIQYRRYLSSLYLLHQPQLSLTEAGLESGYYDQSHFIRDFKAFTQLTPSEYRHRISMWPGHLLI